MLKNSLISLLLVFILFFPSLITAQDVIFNQDFEGTNPFNGFVLQNLDKGIPAESSMSVLSDSAWVVRPSGVSGNHAAVGVSFYNPAVQVDDWFITPAINLGSASRLEWDAMSLSSTLFDSYEIYISTSSQTVNGCLLNLHELQIANEQAGSFKHWELNLAEHGYANLTVYIGFHLATPAGGLGLAVDNIKVTDDSYQSPVSLTFIVDMSKYRDADNFNPATDTVDIAGNFNGWDGTLNIMSMIPESDSSKYTITVPGFHDGDELEFKFRINSSWDDTAVEFPYGGPNRLWTIANGKYTYTAYYNEEGSISSINEINRPDALISVYPNPVDNQLNLKFPKEIDRIMIFSLNGVLLKEVGNPSSEKSIDVQDLIPGTYVLLFRSSEGYTLSRKFLKK